MWKDAVVTQFEVSSWHLLGENEENHENILLGEPVFQFGREARTFQIRCSNLDMTFWFEVTSLAEHERLGSNRDTRLKFLVVSVSAGNAPLTGLRRCTYSGTSNSCVDLIYLFIYLFYFIYLFCFVFGR
jgi:hypothetical protein